MEACLQPYVSCQLSNDNNQQRTKNIGKSENVEKYSQKNVRIVYNSMDIYVCLCVCVDYICVSFCVIVLVIFSECVCVCEDTCATRQIWGCLLDIWVMMCSQSCDSLTD